MTHDAAKEAVIGILQDQADHEWDRDDTATADRIIAKLAEMGFKAPEPWNYPANHRCPVCEQEFSLRGPKGPGLWTSNEGGKMTCGLSQNCIDLTRKANAASPWHQPDPSDLPPPETGT